MTSLRAVIFDRDGVLTRFDFAPVLALFDRGSRVTLEDLWVRWHAWYTSRPLPRTDDEQRAFLAAFWDAVASELGLDDACRARLHAFDYTRTLHAFDDARRALAAARALGLRIGVLSNFPLVGLERSLEATGLAELVDVAIAATVEGVPKPDPRAYRAMLDALGVTADECALVDNEPPCVEGARSVGIRSYLLDRGGRAEAGADLVVGDLDRFATLLGAQTRPSHTEV